MGEWKPLYISLMLIITLGIFIPFVVSSVIDVDPNEVDGILGGFIDLVENGVSFFAFSINPFNILGETLKEYLINNIAVFYYIPNIILIPLILMITVGIFYSFVKLLPAT